MGILQNSVNQIISTLGVVGRLGPGYESRQEAYNLSLKEKKLGKLATAEQSAIEKQTEGKISETKQKYAEKSEAATPEELKTMKRGEASLIGKARAQGERKSADAEVKNVGEALDLARRKLKVAPNEKNATAVLDLEQKYELAMARVKKAYASKSKISGKMARLKELNDGNGKE